MGAFENQLHENETFDSMIELYGKALDSSRAMEQRLIDRTRELATMGEKCERLAEAAARSETILIIADRVASQLNFRQPHSYLVVLYTEARTADRSAQDKAERGIS